MIFITGATGFLGSHLLHALAGQDKPVKALYRNSEKLAYVRKIFQYYGNDTESLMKKIEWVKGDILDYQRLTDCLKDVEQVYHCAGMVSFNNSEKRKMFDTNIAGTTCMVNACLEMNIARICFVSSISALGISQNGDLIDENRQWNQGPSASPYSFSKFRSEMEMWRGIHEGLNAIIVNPSVIIGPGMWLGSTGNLFQQITKGLNYYPTGASGYVDVRDVAAVMISLTNSDITGERFIISAENETHRQIIGYLAEALNKPLPSRPLTPALINIICSLEKIRSLITGKPERITQRSVRSATAVYAYSNKKVTDALSIEFIPVKESIAYSSMLYRNDMNSGL